MVPGFGFFTSAKPLGMLRGTECFQIRQRCLVLYRIRDAWFDSAHESCVLLNASREFCCKVGPGHSI